MSVVFPDTNFTARIRRPPTAGVRVHDTDTNHMLPTVIGTKAFVRTDHPGAFTRILSRDFFSQTR